jgi:DNA-binding IclR family transcriptional regulator
MEPSGGRYGIRVIDRAVRVLSLLADGQPRTLSRMSEELGISNSTTFRLLASLGSHGMVERDPRDGTYRLGLACLQLASAYFDGHDIRRLALAELESLRDETGETVHLGVLNETMEVIYLEKLHGFHAIGLMSSGVGKRSPAYCTGLGKIQLAYADPTAVQRHFQRVGLPRYTDRTITELDELLKHLAQVRGQGYALDRGEHEVEVRCVAAPIFDHSGSVQAAISVSGPAVRLEPVEARAELIERTQRAAAAVSARLGYRPNFGAPRPAGGGEQDAQDR